MTPKRTHKPYSEYEMMMLRHGWNPRIEIAERQIEKLQRPTTARRKLTCAMCKHLATMLRSTADWFEQAAAIRQAG